MADVKASGKGGAAAQVPGKATIPSAESDPYLQQMRANLASVQQQQTQAQSPAAQSSGKGGQMTPMERMNAQANGTMPQAPAAPDYNRQIEDAQKALNSATANYSQGLDKDGKPIALKFNSLIDPTTGLLNSQYHLNAGDDIKANSASADEIRKRALATGPSDWANAAYAKQALGQTDQMDSARNQSAGAQDQTLNALMMQGGLSGGSRERIGNQTLKAQLMAAQQVGRQGQQDRAGIDLQDQSQKNQYLGQAAGYDYQDAGLGMQNRQYQTDVSQKNLQAALSEIGNQRGFDQNTFNQQMQAWAANKQADAQSKAASSGGGKK